MKYNIYQCTKCRKKTQEDNNPNHYLPNKCNLTYKCNGQLKLINQTNMRYNINPLQYDWKSRFDDNKIQSIQSINYSILNSGDSLLIILDELDQDEIKKQCRVVQKELSTAIEYTFYRTKSNNFINGYDDSTYRKKLSIPNNSTLLVYVNDSLLEPSDIEIIDDSIIIHNLINENNEIKIIVNLPVEDIIINLNFIRHDEDVYSAYQDAKHIVLNNKTYYLYYVDISNFKDVELIVDDPMKIVIANDPYTVNDKVYNKVYNIESGDIIMIDSKFKQVKTQKGSSFVFPDMIIRK